jgi:hypothetical protein
MIAGDWVSGLADWREPGRLQHLVEVRLMRIVDLAGGRGVE